MNRLIQNEEDEKEDYMSSIFIQGEEKTSKEAKDNKREKKRKSSPSNNDIFLTTDSHKHLEQQQQLQKSSHYTRKNSSHQKEVSSSSSKIVEQLNRLEKLRKSIQEENPNNTGYKLMIKMGYKEGMKLGKNYDKDVGLMEPIPIIIKGDRAGLGQNSKTSLTEDPFAPISREDTQENRNFNDDDNNSKSIEKFRTIQHAKIQDRETEFHILKLRRIVQELDEKAGLDRHSLWPDDPDAELKSGPSSIKESLTQLEREIIEEDNEIGKLESLRENKDIEFRALSLHERLHLLLEYVRTHYSYCFYCGCQFHDREDMEINCPGKTKDNHE